jgi:hypothetical protein
MSDSIDLIELTPSVRKNSQTSLHTMIIVNETGKSIDSEIQYNN